MATALPAPSATLDFGRAFRIVFEDPEWIKKVLIGGIFVLLSPLLVGIPFVLGYFGRTTRNVAAGIERPLPEWDDFGGLFHEGLRLAAVYLLHVVGAFAVAAALGCVALLPAMALGGLSGVGSRSGDDVAQGASALTGLAIMAGYGLLMLQSLLLAIYLPAALVRTALSGVIADGFAWRRNVDFIRANIGNYALSLVIGLLGGFVAQLGILLCCIGVFPAAFWGYLTLAAALGETVRLNPTSL